MGDHHHHSHHMHHAMTDSTEATTDFSTLPTTTAATILQTLLNTVMPTVDPHQHHHTPVDTVHQHIGHHMSSDQAASDFVQTTDLHASHMTGGDHQMPMYFYFSTDSIILFKEWSTSTTTGLLFSVIGIIILAMLYEGLKFFREWLFKKYFTSLEYSSVSVLGEDGRPTTEVHKVTRNRMFSWPHATQTLLQAIQVVLSYFLMLIFMTYNGWLCIAVVMGSTIGYFLFGWRKATVVDITEHCH